MTESRRLVQLSRLGLPVETGGDNFVVLDDRDALWLIVAGEVDVFSVQLADGRVVGPRRYLWSASVGQAVLGADRGPGSDFGLLAVGVADTRLRKIPLPVLGELAADPAWMEDISALIDSYVTGLARAVCRRVQPQVQAQLEPGEQAILKQGDRVGAQQDVVWVRHESGELLFAGRDALRIGAADGPIPLARGLWLAAADDGVPLSARSTSACIQDGSAWQGVDRVRKLFTSWAWEHAREDEGAEAHRLDRKATAEQQMRERSLADLGAVLAPPTVEHLIEAGEDPLLTACRAVGAAADITFQAPHGWETTSKAKDPLAAICRISRVRMRQVALRGHWWRRDNGPLLVFAKETGAPLALLPVSSSRYELLDPSDLTRSRVSGAVAAGLEPFAVTFYRPFPSEPITGLRLAKLAFSEVRSDLRLVLVLALLSGVLGLVLPMATGKLFGEIVPRADPQGLLTLFGTLVGMSLGIALFDLTRAFALVRVETRSTATLQAAVVDRLLAQPVPFFRQYTIGDLAQRTGGIIAVRDLLSGAAATSILGGVFSTVNLALLFYYDARLAVMAIGLLLVAVLITVAFSVPALRVERRRQDVQGRIAGLVFQMIGGIAKLRVAGAESRAFSVWARVFRVQKELAFQAGNYQNAVRVFNDVLPFLSSLALFAAAGYLVRSGHDISMADFVAFNAAFGTFFASGIALSNAAINLLNVKPIMDRAQPILMSLPEIDASQPDPGELTGRVEANHVSFRYSADSPLALDDVSFHAEPGEFIAFVGPSGSGKSTLMRLLLGFESPKLGGIYYDGQDLTSVNVEAVRTQIGVVLQSSRLLSGSIYQNIVGSSPLTIDDALEAAEMAGIAADIREMPMGMHTMVSEGGSTLSGGQRQRLLIARALVRKPRLILFDEATSALDNRTQELVSQSLDQINSTRIVIAHRLSTIRHAHRIYAIQGGRVVQSGTFDSLSQQPGLFADLIARQLA
jgi:NHLM bacteriocin system ABC transporter ATP-binding protein